MTNEAKKNLFNCYNESYKKNGMTRHNLLAKLDVLDYCINIEKGVKKILNTRKIDKV